MSLQPSLETMEPSILYIEDDPGLYDLLRRRLEDRQYKVTHAPDGPTALGLIDKTNFDLVLVDHMLPNMTGLEVVERLSKQTTSPPLVMLTAHGDEALAVKAMKIGAADYIVKDKKLNYIEMLPDLLYQIVRQQLEKQHVSAQINYDLEKLRSDLMAHFIRDASHEFRTPLTVIKTSAYLLSHMATDDKQKQYLGEILSKSDDIVHLVEDLVYLASLDSQAGLIKTVFPVNALLAQITSEQRETFKKEGLTIVVNLPTEEICVEGAISELTRCISEILENSRQASSGGEIILRLKKRQGKIEIEVQDFGHGIPEEHLPYIFDRFFRGNSAHTTRGFGLGLAIAKRIAALHGGQIYTLSTVGTGTKTTITLPTTFNHVH